MAITAAQAWEAYTRAECLHDARAVEAVIDRMAAEISARLKDSNPLVLCVMTGGVVTTGLLVPKLEFPLQLDYLHATRYRNETRGGDLQWIAHPSIALRDRTVLVVDDILDEGATLAAIMAQCRSEGAREVLSACLVDKLHDRKVPGLKADYLGLTVPDRYVFGYGMDYKGYLRNVPGIFAAAAQDE